MKTTYLLLFFLCSYVCYSQDFQEIDKIVSPDRGGAERFGNSVDVDGDRAIVGIERDSEDEGGLNPMTAAGSAIIYERDAAGSWNQVQKIVASNRAFNANFGKFVAISGDYALVGASGLEDTVAGLGIYGGVYIFERDAGGVWNETELIIASDIDSLMSISWKGEISDSTILIGCFESHQDELGLNWKSGAGAAYFIQQDAGGDWNNFQKVVASDRGPGDLFGWDVGISGDHAIVSAPNERDDDSSSAWSNSMGAAYIFERGPSGVWTEVEKVISSDREIGENFGYSADIDGDYAVVGDPLDNGEDAGGGLIIETGSGYIFERDGAGGWNQVKHVEASDEEYGDVLGWTSSISGKFVVLGAWWEDENAAGTASLDEAGSAYVIKRGMTGNWYELQKINNSDRAIDDNFSDEINISGNTIFGAATAEDEDESGSNTLLSAGSAYIFESCYAQASVISWGVLEASEAGLSYQWIDCSDLSSIPGATSQKFIPTDDGSYAVIVSDGSCTDTSDCIALTNVSLEEFESTGVMIYPNPFKEDIHLALVNAKLIRSCRVLNAAGQEVAHFQELENQYLSFRLEEAKGLYILELEDVDGGLIRARVIKN